MKGNTVSAKTGAMLDDRVRMFWAKLVCFFRGHDIYADKVRYFWRCRRCDLSLPFDNDEIQSLENK
jgi:hypothetical protein